MIIVINNIVHEIYDDCILLTKVYFTISTFTDVMCDMTFTQLTIIHNPQHDLHTPNQTTTIRLLKHSHRQKVIIIQINNAYWMG